LIVKFRPELSALEGRDTPAAVSFSAGVLTVQGDPFANQITVAADASGAVVVSDGAASVAAGVDKAAVKLVVVNGGNGDDSITLDRSLNVLDAAGKLASAPDFALSGGNGNDFIQVNSGGFLGGVVGAPIVGNGFQYGGNGNDFLDSGFGNDAIYGGNGNDTYRWRPGTLIDTFDGGNGSDTGIILGNSNQGDAFVLQADGKGGALFQRVKHVPFSVGFTNTETIQLAPGSGDDSVFLGPLAGSGVRAVAVDGGAGIDKLTDRSGVSVTAIGVEVLN
jgi:Ca2+-binding RTX toxin-like protein